jgi:membrane-associated tyrosine/threonine-specific cdc2-inhibitory kinase
MAPELLHGEFGKPADIFSLGMTLLEMATDLDTPAHGHGWQMLRQNEFPVQFLSGKRLPYADADTVC